uniref:Uncharacterized protein n=1 Tax=Anopheles atroparvus TaxID=41427 RepID=A0AAG5DAP9_ANOAO
MRSRTEMVTTTLDGSDFEEDSDFEDSEEDWKPEKGEQKSLKRKSRDIISGTVGGGRRSGAGRSNGKKRGRKPAARGRAGRKRKSGDHSEDEDDVHDDEEEDDDPSDSEEDERSAPPARKRGRAAGSTGGAKKRAHGRKGLTKTSPSTSKRAAGCELTLKPIPRKVVNLASSFPDKSGNLKLYAFRGDLEEGIRDNLKVCLWRRDGSSLLQKYFRDKSVDASTPQFTSSMVYSCWEDKRSDQYMEVKVRCIEQAKQLRVQIVDVEAVEKKAKEEYEKFIAQHGKSSGGGAGGRSNGTGRGAGSRGRKSKRASKAEEEEEEEEEDDTGDDESDEELEDEQDEQEEEEEGDDEAPGEEAAEEDEANANGPAEGVAEPVQEE